MSTTLDPSNEPTDRRIMDVLILGSGPAGTHAALGLVSTGISVGLLDVGFVDDTYQPRIPDAPFSEIRRTDADQSFYFLGQDREGVFADQSRAGAHLTPPRQHMVKQSDELFPTESSDFAALFATSRGGLGASWGANCFSFSDDELKAIGIPADQIKPYYQQVASEIGVAADANSDIHPFISNFEPLQPALQIDGNARTILDAYSAARAGFNARDFHMGPSPLASLTRDHDGRRANRYYDMDFWSDHGKTVYRPRFSIDKLRTFPNFTYLTQRLALRFIRPSNPGEPVRVIARNLTTGTEETFLARRLILACGAINTFRLVAESLGQFDVDGPLLCNPNEWVACLNLRMLGRPSPDPRHSLAQLTAVMFAPSVNPKETDTLIGQFYSYRSLLLFRLLKDIPFPTFVALPLVRLMLSAMTMVNLHFPDRPGPRQLLRLTRSRSDGPASSTLKITFEREPHQSATIRAQERRFLRHLFRLGVIPLKVNRPKHGASIHYAGTVPMSDQAAPLRCRPTGNLWESPEVYIADSASWNFLPAKGLTFTIMAHARLIADRVLADLKQEKA